MRCVRLLLSSLLPICAAGSVAAQVVAIALNQGQYPVATITNAKSDRAVTDQMVRDCIVRNGADCSPGGANAWASGSVGVHNLIIVRCDTSDDSYYATAVHLPETTSKKSMFKAALSEMAAKLEGTSREIIRSSCRSAVSFHKGQFFVGNKRISPTYDVTKTMQQTASSLKGTNWCGRNPEARATDALDTVCVKFNRFDQKGRAPSRMVIYKNGKRVRGMNWKLSYSVSPDLQTIKAGLTGLVLTYEIARGRMTGFAPDDEVTLNFQRQ